MMLRIVKKVLIMTVNPGNAGQMYMPYVGEKITHLLSLKDEMKFKTILGWRMWCGQRSGNLHRWEWTGL